MMRLLLAAAMALGSLVMTGQRLDAGVITVAGTGNGKDLVEAVGAAYAAEHPAVRVSVPPSVHTSGGLQALMRGEAGLARIGRPLTAAERRAGIVAVPVARISAAIVAHPSVTLRGITVRQAADLFAGRIANWKEIGGPDLRVRIVRRNEEDATLQALRAQLPGWAELAFPARSRLAATAQEALEFVRNAEGAIGFSAYSRELDAYLNVLEVNGVHPFDERYPYAVTLQIAYKAGTLSAEAKSFLGYWRSETARHLARRLGASLIGR